MLPNRKLPLDDMEWTTACQILNILFFPMEHGTCLLYTSDAADDSLRVDLGGRRIIKKKKKKKIIINFFFFSSRRLHTIFFFFKQKTAYEIGVRLVGSEMCIRDRAYKI